RPDRRGPGTQPYAGQEEGGPPAEGSEEGRGSQTLGKAGEHNGTARDELAGVPAHAVKDEGQFLPQSGIFEVGDARGAGHGGKGTSPHVPREAGPKEGRRDTLRRG